MGQSFKEYQIVKILERQQGNITGIRDLIGDGEPSLLFYILANKLGYLLDNDVDSTITKEGVEWRRKFHPVIEKLGPYFLKNPQVFENREFLKDPKKYDYNPKNAPKDPGIILPDSPVIWTPNHAFKDDVLASILAAQRHAYILFGSLPQFYNSIDGVLAYLNGVAMCNRKVKESRHASTKKIVRSMEYGADALIFPEGIWNKEPDRYIIDLWSGFWIAAKETGAPVVPIIHYLKEHLDKSKTNLIHTVVDDPIKIDDLSESAAKELLRDVLATWHHLMIEYYGKSNREEILGKYDNSYDAWTNYIEKKVSEVPFYDSEIECGPHAADYRPKDKPHIADVYASLADTKHITKENASEVAYALTRKKYDYQRLY